MHKTFLILFLYLFSNLTFAQRVHQELWVFCKEVPKNQLDVQWMNEFHLNITWYDLSEWDAILNDLNKDLPNTEKEALEHLDKKMEAMGGKDQVKRKMRNAYRPYVLAEFYGIKSFPSMLINKKKTVNLKDCRIESIKESFSFRGANLYE